MFSVIFRTDGGAVDPGPARAAGHDVEFPDSTRRVAFISSKAGPVSAAAGAGGIRRLGGRYWIVGRIRLDARADLVSLLADRIAGSPADASDAELCLYAYAEWGDAFVDRLAGDFCFALWDAGRHRLISVRDQLGVRCLFHAEAKGIWFVGDSLDWIVAQAPIARDLDDAWIADFLSVGHCLEFEPTVYRHIRRLAPAHVLTISEAGAAVRRYWRLDIPEPLYFRNRRHYAERFLDLLSQSIADRLPAGRVGISMSGGLDSPTLAACAVGITGDPARVAAECFHFETSVVDEEKRFSSLVARHLGIELRLRAMDNLTYDPEWRSRSIATAEPWAAIITADPERTIAREQAGKAQVWFYGEGPDNALAFERNDYLKWLAGRGDWGRLVEAGLLYLKAKGTSDWIGTLRRHAGPREAIDDTFVPPPWLDRALVDRVDLPERLRGVGAAATSGHPSGHPWHPRAFASFNDPIWTAIFAGFDVEETLAPLVWRHPFLDLRVLTFMLSVPPVPWAREKLLLREAMQGRLPAEVLARKKVGFADSSLPQPIRTHGLPALSRTGGLENYVDVAALPTALPSGRDLDRIVAVHALDHWLTARTP